MAIFYVNVEFKMKETIRIEAKDIGEARVKTRDIDVLQDKIVSRTVISDVIIKSVKEA
jgi:hypothetical protein